MQVTTYTQASAELLGIQIDAAINSGNSGGPAFNRCPEEYRFQLLRSIGSVCIHFQRQEVDLEGSAEEMGNVLALPFRA